tara:strand:- start:547 stop:1143 length:597 start_codon:yes stop_codon:yes gene_type:complete
LQQEQVFEMNIKKIFIYKFFLFIVLINSFLLINKVKSAEQIKITYSIFSRTINIKSLKNYSLTGKPEKNLERLLKATNASNDEILNILNKNFDIPLPIASKLLYSEVGNIILSRLSKIIHPPNARDEVTGKLALRSSVIKGIDLGKGKINLINFFEGYPTKTVILNAKALSKILNKVESINELLKFFTDSPLNKIKDS